MVRNSKILEVCIDADKLPTLAQNIHSALSAGATRIELCAAMASDGLTPTPLAIATAKQAMLPNTELLVMIRPLPGRFVVTSQTLQDMLQSITTAATLGADGVVFGALTESQALDLMTTAKLQQHAAKYGLKSTFHRAFDAIANSEQAITALINLGIHRVLTSGTPWGSNRSALDGQTRIAELLNYANGQIEIVVGGGVNAQNATALFALADNCAACVNANTFSLHSFSGVYHPDGQISANAIQAILQPSQLQETTL
ncbi:copper homeostasis protein CutC [Pseudoalteromonas fenneropenaei]|uniref:Copper homeostasis protein cutC homolog n=1 Tax=Pseudoalteromonas fenneropenaei TaxID=1737459 RepID=A0ABV7CHZ1_9GAMM